MATKKLFFLFSILLSMVGAKALAYDIAVENADGKTIYYNYINDGKELEVTSGESDDRYVGSVVIPEEVTYMNRTRKVTSIRFGAFSYCRDLNYVTIPNSVTSIEQEAFYCCSGLTSITIPNSVTSIGQEAFRNCSGLSSMTIGNGVKYIAEGAFYNCSCLTSVTIPNNVTSIGNEAFSGCIGLNSITIGNGVTSIGESAFSGCGGLTSVTIPNSVTSIGQRAFRNCSGLTSVTIGNSVTSIGDGAFYDCCGLTSVTIPNSVTSIGDGAFGGYDLSEVISKIEEPFGISIYTFSESTFYNATLYVPKGTIDKYKANVGWKKFLFIEEENGSGDTPETQKCEKPTITFKDGKLIFSCTTEGVNYQYNITASSVASGAGNNIDFTPKYTITAYATKDGYEDSDTATLEVPASDTANGDMNGDGVIDAADIVKIVNIIMEQNE